MDDNDVEDAADEKIKLGEGVVSLDCWGDEIDDRIPLIGDVLLVNGVGDGADVDT